MTNQPVLSNEEKRHFLERGYVVLHDCFAREIAREWTDAACATLGIDRDDASTWVEKRVHIPGTKHVEVKEFAPRAWQAATELLGGQERIAQPYNWSDGFIFNLGIGADEPWRAPSAAVQGWHKDGDFFRHFLDSPEQGLLTLVLWSDIAPRGGGTFIAPDSVGVVARFLASHPEGLLPNEVPCRELIKECNEFVEMSGNVGDVVLLHPFMLHTVSQNHARIARIITNPPITLREPMNFHREDGDYSLNEQAVLRALNCESFDFRPTTPREKFVPERVQRDKKKLEEIRQRAAA